MAEDEGGKIVGYVLAKMYVKYLLLYLLWDHVALVSVVLLCSCYNCIVNKVVQPDQALTQGKILSFELM